MGYGPDLRIICNLSIVDNRIRIKEDFVYFVINVPVLPSIKNPPESQYPEISHNHGQIRFLDILGPFWWDGFSAMAQTPTRRERHVGYHWRPRFLHQGGGVSLFGS
jgi:hypothetical protein